MRKIFGFLCLAILGYGQGVFQFTNETGVFNKLCCTSTITSREIKFALEKGKADRRMAEPSQVGEFSLNSLLVQNEENKDEEFPSDSLFAPNSPALTKQNYGMWATSLFEASSQKIPGDNFHYYIYGAGLGMNYFGFESCAIGAGLLYDHINLIQDHGQGRQTSNYLFATFYASFPIRRFMIDLALTGGGFFTDSKRNATTATAKASYPGYQIIPHMDMNYDFDLFQNLTFSPFYQIDWGASVRSSFKEHGAGAADLTESSMFASVLRQEVGLNFFERWDLQEKGSFVFRQKGSYVHLIPFQHGSATVGSPIIGGLPILLLPEAQNYGSWALEMQYHSNTKNLVLCFEGFYGSGFVNDAVYLTYSQGF